MNRRRSEPAKSHLALYLALGLMAVVGTTGGAMHAIYRNAQIRVERQIDQVAGRIEQHELDIQMIDVRAEKLLDRFELREQLHHLNSDLVPVTHGVVEKVRPLGEGPAVASRS